MIRINLLPDEEQAVGVDTHGWRRTTVPLVLLAILLLEAVLLLRMGTDQRARLDAALEVNSSLAAQLGGVERELEAAAVVQENRKSLEQIQERVGEWNQSKGQGVRVLEEVALALTPGRADSGGGRRNRDPLGNVHLSRLNWENGSVSLEGSGSGAGQVGEFVERLRSSAVFSQAGVQSFRPGVSRSSVAQFVVQASIAHGP